MEIDFQKSFGSFAGVYKNFNEAINSAPKGHIGYNNEETIKRVLNRCNELQNKIQPAEYPVFFYLNYILNQNKKINIFDVGGAFGVHYFKYSKFCPHNNFVWTVFDVKKIVEKGQEIFDNKNLKFTINFNELENQDILLSSGAIQYIENFSLKNIKNKPKHIIFSRLPIIQNVDTFVTLQNGGSSFNPQYVFNKKEFIHLYEDLGYEVIDEWNEPDSCIIPGHSDKSCYSYSGFYLKLKT